MGWGRWFSLRSRSTSPLIEIAPSLFFTHRREAKTIEVKASHLSLISHPDEITRLILEADGQQA